MSHSSQDIPHSNYQTCWNLCNTFLDTLKVGIRQGSSYLNFDTPSSAPQALNYHDLSSQFSGWRLLFTMMVALLTCYGCIHASMGWLFRSRRSSKSSLQRSVPDMALIRASDDMDETPARTDPGLLRKHSRVSPYDLDSGINYPAIRTFYRPHPKSEKLPSSPYPLPLLVFVHGLGGSLAQFASLLDSLANIAPCFGIDLPGCGLSEYDPHSWDAYKHDALVGVVRAAVERVCDESGNRRVVLIGHSMGCSINVSLAVALARDKTAATGDSSADSIFKASRFDILGLIALCPRASVFSQKQVRLIRSLLYIPTPIFDLWRRWDRRGGTKSPGVTRFVGQDASTELKKLQLRFNEQSQTSVWRRMSWGALPVYQKGAAEGGLPGPDVWAQLTGPVLLIAGESDTVTKPEEISVLRKAMGRKSINPLPSEDLDQVQEDSPASESSKAVPNVTHTISTAEDYGGTGTGSSNRVLQTSILPKPASHTLPYDPATYRTISGLIQTFLSAHVDRRLSLGWQLQHLKEANIWDVKNLAKWKAVEPVSEPVGGVFRALKTLRALDDVHSPIAFVEHWRDKIRAVIDISHEPPVYDARELEAEGIEYHKFPTVSKIPPTPEEARGFIELVDSLRAQVGQHETGKGVSGDMADDNGEERLIGVHCHYGFNRTGFFTCSYLIERERYSVQAALDEFQRARPPGIRHEHFIDTLFVRYCVGLKRAPTL